MLTLPAVSFVLAAVAIAAAAAAVVVVVVVARVVALLVAMDGVTQSLGDTDIPACVPLVKPDGIKNVGTHPTFV